MKQPLKAKTKQSSDQAQDWAGEGVSVLVPTYQRPEGIRIALISLLNQDVGARPFEIVVADNDPAASAREIVSEISASAPGRIHYTHVPEPGVSNARNAAMAKARGRFIAFLDDDMEALDGWLSSLISTSLRLSAGLVFGPAVARMPDLDDPRNPYLEPFFSRVVDKADEGYIRKTLGTGGCLLDLKLCALPSPVFDPEFNETGGEDDELFSHLRAHGTQVGWSPKAKAWEHVPPSRATDAYIWTRNFAFGQGAITIGGEATSGQTLKTARHMLIGTAQTVIYAPLWMVLKTLGRPAYVDFMARTAQGLGKIFWSDRFSPKLYGSAVLKTAETAS